MVTRREFNHLILGAAAATCLPDIASAEAVAGETGTLDDRTLAVLKATAEVVTGVQPLQGYYEDYYSYSALQRAGYLSLYRDFAGRVDRTAKRLGRADFLACDASTRAGIVEKTRSILGGGSRFENPIFQETLAVFERTDAWLQLGYAAWPGSPRGQDFYKQPI